MNIVPSSPSVDLISANLQLAKANRASEMGKAALTDPITALMVSIVNSEWNLHDNWPFYENDFPSLKNIAKWQYLDSFNEIHWKMQQSFNKNEKIKIWLSLCLLTIMFGQFG